MTLDTSRPNLSREVYEAEQFRDGFLESWDRMIGSFHGPHYRRHNETNWSAPENRYFEVVQMLLARLVHENPSVRVKSRRTTEEHMDVAEAIQHALNRWIRDFGLKYTLESIALDYLFAWGVGMVKTGGRPGTVGWNKAAPNEDASWPILEHVDPRLYFHDHQATKWSEIRFQGHVWFDDVDTLLEMAEEDETWDKRELRELPKDAGLDVLFRDTKDRSTRKEVVGYEVWVPEAELDEFPDGSPEPKGGWRKNGYNGVIYTLAHCQVGGTGQEAKKADEKLKKAARFIRAPRPYFGPKWGPYVVFGAFEVPGKTYPLGLFTAIEDELRDLNDTALVQRARNRRHKRMVAFPLQAQAEAQKVQSAGDDHVVLMPPGPDGKVLKPEMFEVGGSTQEDFNGFLWKSDRVDRLLGISQAHQGNVGGSTATEVAVADQALNARMALLARNFERGVTEILARAGEAMYRDEDIVFPLGGDVAEQMGLGPQPMIGAMGVPITDEMGRPVMVQADPWFRGGADDKNDPTSGADWAALELELEPYSMGYVDQAAQQRQAVELIQLLVSLLPAIREFPELDGRQVLKIIASAWNNPAVARLIDPEKAQEMMGGMGVLPEQPRLKSDAGRVGLRGQGNATPSLLKGTVGSLMGNQRGQQTRQNGRMLGVG